MPTVAHLCNLMVLAEMRHALGNDFRALPLGLGLDILCRPFPPTPRTSDETLLQLQPPASTLGMDGVGG